jgi:hypothetical protein
MSLVLVYQTSENTNDKCLTKNYIFHMMEKKNITQLLKKMGIYYIYIIVYKENENYIYCTTLLKYPGNETERTTFKFAPKENKQILLHLSKKFNSLFNCFVGLVLVLWYLMPFSTIFISWQSILLVEETRVPGGNH